MNSDQAASVPDTETVTAGDLRAAIRASYNAAAGYAVFAMPLRYVETITQGDQCHE